MSFGVFIQGWKHDRENDGSVFRQQTHDVFVVPIVESTFGHL